MKYSFMDGKENLKFKCRPFLSREIVKSATINRHSCVLVAYGWFLKNPLGGSADVQHGSRAKSISLFRRDWLSRLSAGLCIVSITFNVSVRLTPAFWFFIF